MIRRGIIRFVDGILLLALCAGCVTTPQPGTPPCFELTADHVWHLNPPHSERFDASGLLLRKDGEVWTISDRGSSLYRIRFCEGTNEADLIEVPGIFTASQLSSFASAKLGYYDGEGIGEDDQGRLYLCEEADRWILRYDPETKGVERMDIDWSPVKKYFDPVDRNASFEGVAFGEGRLFVANERRRGRIIVVDPVALKVVDDFTVRLSHMLLLEIHYSDLCWFEGSLFALLRDNRCLVQIEPKTHRVLAEYSFAAAERRSEFDYHNLYGTSAMEGLAVDRDYFWLVTDNNGRPRRSDPKDKRPSLVRFLRPRIEQAPVNSPEK